MSFLRNTKRYFISVHRVSSMVTCLLFCFLRHSHEVARGCYTRATRFRHHMSKLVTCLILSPLRQYFTDAFARFGTRALLVLCSCHSHHGVPPCVVLFRWKNQETAQDGLEKYLRQAICNAPLVRSFKAYQQKCCRAPSAIKSNFSQCSIRYLKVYSVLVWCSFSFWKTRQKLCRCLM